MPSRAGGHCTLELERRLKFLSSREMSVIDDLLASVSPCGEMGPVA